MNKLGISKEILGSAEYRFLQDKLGNRLMILAIGGSHAYGVNVETSDLDLRGCVLEKPSDLIGFTSFEQLEDNETDTVLYSFNKLVRMLLGCNPNVIEILGCKPEHYLYLSKEGTELIENRKMFLSKRCINSFGGYAYQQLNRINNVLAGDRFSQTDTEKRILNSIKSAMLTFENRYKKFEKGSIVLNVGESQKESLDSEIFMNINLTDYPLRDFVGILGEMQNILRSYNKINSRNKKKDDEHLDKHAMHLMRLYLMAIDILEKEEIITYRGKDKELLLDIRNGKFRKEDGTYDDSFFEMVDEYRKKFEYAIENTSLPNNPDMKKIEEFVMEINKKIIREDI